MARFGQEDIAGLVLQPRCGDSFRPAQVAVPGVPDTDIRAAVVGILAAIRVEHEPAAAKETVHDAEQRACLDLDCAPIVGIAIKHGLQCEPFLIRQHRIAAQGHSVIAEHDLR
jgi:hypothetical protein